MKNFVNDLNFPDNLNLQNSKKLSTMKVVFQLAACSVASASTTIPFFRNGRAHNSKHKKEKGVGAEVSTGLNATALEVTELVHGAKSNKIRAVSTWPGEANVWIDGGLFHKQYIGPDNPQMSRRESFANEKAALLRLEQFSNVCDRGERHFPTLMNAYDKEMVLIMSRQGETIQSGGIDEYGRMLPYHPVRGGDSKRICVRNFSLEKGRKQAACITKIMKAAGIRHLDLYCPPGCDFQRCTEFVFSKCRTRNVDFRSSSCKVTFVCC